MMFDDESDDDEDDGWKILKPGVILFETTIGSLDKPIPHPILDDPSKMMKIIANPLYDKLTLSRAAHIQKYHSSEFIRRSSQLNRLKERPTIIPSKSTDIDQTITTSLPNSSETSSSRPQSKSSSKRQNFPPFHLPTEPISSQKPPRNIPLSAHSRSTTTQKSSRNIPSSAHSRSTTTQKPPRNIPSSAHFHSTTARKSLKNIPSIIIPSRATTARSATQSIQAALTDTDPNTKQPIVDGTIRYVSSRHGFEVQRYSSSNWLLIDIFTKDACQSHEKTFREMLDKKTQYERLSRSIYSSDYYIKRWNELLESYKHGDLTHSEWAQQNYQLLCLRTLYIQAKKREQRDRDLIAQNVRRDRAKSAYKQWKETKTEENSEHQQSHLNIFHSPRTTEGTSFLLNNSSSIPISNILDDNNTTLADTSHQMLTSMCVDSETQPTSTCQPIIVSKTTSATENALYMLDQQRWSLKAMLKRVVGLAEPLPPPPKFIKRKQSPITNASTDSGFESDSLKNLL